jgi:protein arginine N-methyltransferase 5
MTAPIAAENAEVSEEGAHAAAAPAPGADSVANDPWEWWIRLRQLCVPTLKLAIALELTADLPSGDAVLRWLAEPIKAVIISTSLFLINASGFPVLPKAHQAVVKRLFKYSPQFVIKGSYAKVRHASSLLPTHAHLSQSVPAAISASSRELRCIRRSEA